MARGDNHTALSSDIESRDSSYLHRMVTVELPSIHNNRTNNRTNSRTKNRTNSRTDNRVNRTTDNRINRIMQDL